MDKDAPTSSHFRSDTSYLCFPEPILMQESLALSKPSGHRMVFVEINNEHGILDFDTFNGILPKEKDKYFSQ